MVFASPKSSRLLRVSSIAQRYEERVQVYQRKLDDILKVFDRKSARLRSSSKLPYAPVLPDCGWCGGICVLRKLQMIDM